MEVINAEKPRERRKRRGWERRFRAVLVW